MQRLRLHPTRTDELGRAVSGQPIWMKPSSLHRQRRHLGANSLFPESEIDVEHDHASLRAVPSGIRNRLACDFV